MASLLISSGANVNAPGPGGRTALYYAGGRQLGMMQLLLENGADVNVRDAEGASPLDEAVWNGLLDAVAILLAHGAHLNDPDIQTGATPLNEAAFQGHTQIVRYLLQLHPDVDLPDRKGYTPLDNAARMGKEDAALLLLEAEPKGSNISKTMDTAVTKDESHLVEALIRKGADPDRVLEDAALNGSVAVVTVLLDHGAQMSRVNADSGTTALYAAASFGKAAIVQAASGPRSRPKPLRKRPQDAIPGRRENGFPEIAALIKGPKTCAQ